MHVGLYGYKWLILNLDGVWPIFGGDTFERLRFNGTRSTGKCESRIVPYSCRFLVLHCTRTEAAPASPEIAGDGHIRLLEAQSLHRAEREGVETSRWRAQSSDRSA